MQLYLVVMVVVSGVITVLRWLLQVTCQAIVGSAAAALEALTTLAS